MKQRRKRKAKPEKVSAILLEVIKGFEAFRDNNENGSEFNLNLNLGMSYLYAAVHMLREVGQ